MGVQLKVGSVWMFACPPSVVVITTDPTVLSAVAANGVCTITAMKTGAAELTFALAAELRIVMKVVCVP